MIKVIHRVNSIGNLKRVNNEFGVEVDIRSKNNNLILSHDAFSKGQSLKRYLKYFKHKLIIANIKEEGIEDRVIQLFKNHNLKNYLLLDLSYPFLIKLIKKGFGKKIMGRISKYESYQNIYKLKDKINWVWIDLITNEIPFNDNTYKMMKKNKLKLMLVSPELLGRSKKSISIIKNNFKKRKYLIDAVCTKHPDLW